MITYWWNRLPTKFDVVDLDLYVTMPNHFHGILVINHEVNIGEYQRIPPIDNKAGEYTDSPLQKPTLWDILQWFKIMTTNAYIRGVKNDNWQRFNRKLWQRSFHDHIITSEKSLKRLRRYTLHNPALWVEDKFYGQK